MRRRIDVITFEGDLHSAIWSESGQDITRRVSWAMDVEIPIPLVWVDLQRAYETDVYADGELWFSIPPKGPEVDTWFERME